MEKWVPVEGFALYEVSDYGRVRNASTGRILRQHKNEDTGLLYVALRRDMRQHVRTVHRLVACAYLGDPPDSCVPVHLDEDRTNNTADNLEWQTLSQAREKTLQRNRTEPMDIRRVRHLESGVVYDNALEAARKLNGLERYIIFAAQTGNIYKRGHWSFLFE